MHLKPLNSKCCEMDRSGHFVGENRLDFFEDFKQRPEYGFAFRQALKGYKIQIALNMGDRRCRFSFSPMSNLLDESEPPIGVRIAQKYAD